MDYSKLQNLLDEQMSWPASYDFKFVVKTDNKHKVITHLEEHQISERQSKNGKYTSITSTTVLNSSSDVIAVYKRMSKVEGVITL